MPIRLSRAGTRRCFRPSLLALGAALLAAAPAQAQQPLLDATYPQPRLVSVLPAGGKAGTVVEVACTGVDLEEPERLLFSNPGLKAELVPPPPPDPKKPPPPNAPKPPAVFKDDHPGRRPPRLPRRAPRQQVGRQQRPHLRRRRPDRSPRKGAEQRRAGGPKGRIELHRQRHDGLRHRRRLLRLRRQKGPARRLQLPRLLHRQPLPARASRSTTPRAGCWPRAATTPATTP